MIIKATLITLVIILIIVIATSYYVNKEGFDDITNNLGGAINTVIPDTASSAIIPPPAITQSSDITPQPDFISPSAVISPPLRHDTPPITASSIQSQKLKNLSSDLTNLQTLYDRSIPEFLNTMQPPSASAIATAPPAIATAPPAIATAPPAIAPSEYISNNPLDHSSTKMADDFDKQHDNVRQDINSIAKTIDAILKVESSSITVVNDMDTRINDILNKVDPRLTWNNRIKANSPDINVKFRDLVRKAILQVLKVINARKIQLQIENILRSATPENKTKATEILLAVKVALMSSVASMNIAINNMNAKAFVERDNIATTPSTSGSSPTRTEVVPEVSFSDSGYNAMALQQKSDLLKDIQKVVRNEVLANRSTTPMLYNNECGSEDGKNGYDNDVPKNECGKKPTKDKVTAATSQGKEYENSCYKDKKAGASCPPQPDMAQFIKKDAIPCWGCDLDY